VEREPAWVTLKSSLLAAARYHTRRHWLDIRFRDGDIYRYLGVAPDVFDALMAAVSKGAFFTRHIKGRYLFEVPSQTPMP
jgi:hypothetical protein